VNLEQQYEVWIEPERMLSALPVISNGKRSRKKTFSTNCSIELAMAKASAHVRQRPKRPSKNTKTNKAAATNGRNESRDRLMETWRLYRALRLPMIPSEAAEILREADRRSLLGTHLLVVGTNALPAYFIEAGGRIVNAPAETNDFDMAYPSLAHTE
jgi:hypothetical protein